MSKNKLKKYAETLEYENIIQPTKQQLFNGFGIKGHWHEEVFGNQKPIVLELGAGKGEYSLMLAAKHPSKNFIAVDIKGDRLLKGAKEAKEKNLDNLVFLRIQIEHIELAFEQDEVDEIWITFPDPFPKKTRAKNRMTSRRFLHRYKNILKKNGLVHLKTDNTQFFDFTHEILTELNQEILFSTRDLYSEDLDNTDATGLQTYYERKWLEDGAKIKYMDFRLNLD
ncbi:MAG: tRNA (guanosine(46)-N7)-methyltransferase TrmB [Bacteroidales bacterium]|nr:tRNA (guanosine(46)-N7)-methyltransferase TrmB [Bacteroidales bacterium]MCF8334076.1 tRNA (guanosine(46)-N7)-methyltransferase TrmB [Bacteroidales bacterium]